MAAVRFSAQFHPPPGFNKVIEGIRRHGTFKQRGYVKFDDLRSIALASDRTGYATKDQIAGLRNFLVASATVIEDGSQKYFFDLERALVVLTCCDTQTALPAGINPQQRLKFLKFRQTNKKDPASSDVNDVPEAVEVDVRATTLDTEPVTMRWLIRLTAEQAKVLLSVSSGETTKRVSTLLGVWITDPLKQIGLLIRRGERRLSVWECDFAIMRQCRFDVFPRENHRGIPVVHEVSDGPMILCDQWNKDLETIATGTTTGVVTIVSEQAAVITEPEAGASLPEVIAVEPEPLPSVQMNLPVQYALIQRLPETLTDDELEEAMLAILVFTASLHNRHGQFVAEKKSRMQTKIDAARAEKDRIDAELRDLRSREQELEQARDIAEAKLVSLQQSIAS